MISCKDSVARVLVIIATNLLTLVKGLKASTRKDETVTLINKADECIGTILHERNRLAKEYGYTKMWKEEAC